MAMVLIGFRPFGMDFIIDTSKSAYRTRLRLLGIGVADITRVAASLFLFCSIFLWTTPKRCCSSITFTPSFLKTTFSSINAWVPIRMSMDPISRLSKMSLLAFLLVDPIKSPTFTPRGSSNSTKDSKCCFAKISVGAIIEDW